MDGKSVTVLASVIELVDLFGGEQRARNVRSGGLHGVSFWLHSMAYLFSPPPSSTSFRAQSKQIYYHSQTMATVIFFLR